MQPHLQHALTVQRVIAFVRCTHSMHYLQPLNGAASQHQGTSGHDHSTQVLLAGTTGDGDVTEAAALDLLHDDSTMELLAEVRRFLGSIWKHAGVFSKWTYPAMLELHPFSNL